MNLQYQFFSYIFFSFSKLPSLSWKRRALLVINVSVFVCLGTKTFHQHRSKYSRKILLIRFLLIVAHVSYLISVFCFHCRWLRFPIVVREEILSDPVDVLNLNWLFYSPVQSRSFSFSLINWCFSKHSRMRNIDSFLFFFVEIVSILFLFPCFFFEWLIRLLSFQLVWRWKFVLRMKILWKSKRKNLIIVTLSDQNGRHRTENMYS
jgi:hypothetical protein